MKSIITYGLAALVVLALVYACLGAPSPRPKAPKLLPGTWAVVWGGQKATLHLGKNGQMAGYLTGWWEYDGPGHTAWFHTPERSYRVSFTRGSLKGKAEADDQAATVEFARSRP